MLTLAPEMPGALDLIRHASAAGVRVSLGHTNATDAETEAAIAAGAVSATHTFNAMRPLDHRDPGVLGVVLDQQELFADLICDGIHVAPAAVRLWFRMKGSDRAILITDAMSATGMPDGAYMLGSFAVTVKDGRCSLTEHPETLAGSVLTLDRAVQHLATLHRLYVGNGRTLRLGQSGPIAWACVGGRQFAYGPASELQPVQRGPAGSKRRT